MYEGRFVDPALRIVHFYKRCLYNVFTNVVGVLFHFALPHLCTVLIYDHTWHYNFFLTVVCKQLSSVQRDTPLLLQTPVLLPIEQEEGDVIRKSQTPLTL